jgi:hypothetical protein
MKKKKNYKLDFSALSDMDLVEMQYQCRDHPRDKEFVGEVMKELSRRQKEKIFISYPVLKSLRMKDVLNGFDEDILFVARGCVHNDISKTCELDLKDYIKKSICRESLYGFIEKYKDGIIKEENLLGRKNQKGLETYQLKLYVLTPDQLKKLVNKVAENIIKEVK